ncbi:putative ribonuclease H-like domain-containing protein [Tanacetum coccineum]
MEDDKEIDKHEEAEENDKAEMKKHMEIVQDDEEIAIDAIPLATKPPMIVEYKIVKEGQKGFYHLIRADGSLNRPEDDYERVFLGDLKVMFEPDIKSEVWRSLQGYKVTVWKLLNSCGVVHDKEFNKGTINALQGSRTTILIIHETFQDTKPKIDDKDHFELKGQFLKKLRDNNFSGLDHEDANEYIENVLEIVDLFHEVILFYNGLDVSTRQILDSKGAIPTKTAADAKVAIQEMANDSQNGTMEYLGQEVLKLLTDWLQFKHNSTILEEKSRSRLNDYYCNEKNGLYGLQCLGAYSYGATRVDESLPRKEKDPGSFTLPCYINNFCFENALADLGASVSVMPLLTYLNLGLGELAHTKLTVELADRIVKHPKGITENVLVGIGKFVFPVDFIILDMPEDLKVPLILRRPFLSTAHTKIDVFKRKITLRVGDEKIIFKSVKPASSLM